MSSKSESQVPAPATLHPPLQLPLPPTVRLPALIAVGVALRVAVWWLGVAALTERVEWSVGRSRLSQRQSSAAHSIPQPSAQRRSARTLALCASARHYKPDVVHSLGRDCY